MSQHRSKINNKIILQLDQNYEINELKQVKCCLKELNKLLSNTAKELGKSKEEFERELFEEMHKSKELEQEKILLSDMNKSYVKRINNLEESRKEIDVKIEDGSKTFRELQQEKLILSGMVDSGSSETRVLHKKYYTTIAMAAVVLAAVVASYSIYVVEFGENDYRLEDLWQIKSKYLIQNLRGDTIDTWLSWRLAEGDILHVNIVNFDDHPEKIQVIKNVIQSTEPIEIDDSILHKGPKGISSTYYLGWKGALEKASEQSTRFYVPIKFEIIQSGKGEGDITIELSNLKNGDGYTGYTKSIADENQNQILKSHITIYDADKLSEEQLATITRHEFGHALGLAHSTAPEDLMHPTIKTEFPYISECDIDAIIALYDGEESSQVICEK